MRNSRQQTEVVRIAVNTVGRDMTHFQLTNEPAPALQRKVSQRQRAAASSSTAALRLYSSEPGAAWFESLMADFEGAELEPVR